MNFGVVNAELLKGFLENIELFCITLLLSLPLGLIVSFGSMSKFSPIRFLTKGFVWIIRGTPLMLQLFVVMYVPGLVFDWQIPGNNPRMTAAAIAFVINYACYFSEIYLLPVHPFNLITCFEFTHSLFLPSPTRIISRYIYNISYHLHPDNTCTPVFRLFSIHTARTHPAPTYLQKHVHPADASGFFRSHS